VEVIVFHRVTISANDALSYISAHTCTALTTVYRVNRRELQDEDITAADH